MMYWYCSEKIKLKAKCRNRVYFFHAPFKLFPYLQDPLCCVFDQKHDLKIAKPSILPPGVKEFIQQGFLGPWMVEFSGGSRGGPQGARPLPPLFLDQTEAKGWKMFFGDRPPPPLHYLRIWITACPPPLYQSLDPALELIHVFCIRCVTIFFIFSLHLQIFTTLGKTKSSGADVSATGCWG